MAAGAYMMLPPEARSGRLAASDQRSLDRAFFNRAKGFSPGGASMDPEEIAWLKYIADVGRDVPPVPRARGFAGIGRRG